MDERRFKAGDRVKMADWCAPEHPRIRHRLGTVIGYSRDGQMLRVIHDGNQTAESWSESVWEMVTPNRLTDGG